MKLRIAIISSVIIAGIGGWLLLHSSAAAPASTEVKLYLQPAQLATKQGQEFSESIRLSKVGNEKVDYVSAQLTFPAQLIEVKSVSRSGSAFSNGAGLQVAYSNSKGTLSSTGSGNALANPADVLVVTITFVAKTAGQASLKFSTTSQAGALLGNNTVRNALDTMVGSAVNIAATTQSSTTTTTSNSSSGSTSPSSGSTAKNEPAITTPAARPNSTSILNDAPQSADETMPTNDVGVTAKHSAVHQMSLTLWLVVAGLIAVILGGLLVWLRLAPKDYLRHVDTTESESEIISPQSEDGAAESVNDIAVPFVANSAAKPSTAEAAPEIESSPEPVTAKKEPTPPVPSSATATPIAAQAGPIRSTVPTPKTQPNVSTPKAANAPVAPVRPPVQSVSAQDGNAVPDMFDDGEQRLKSEGL